MRGSRTDEFCAEESLATENLAASLKTTVLLIFLLTVCEVLSIFFRLCIYNYLPTAVIAFNFTSHNSDFSAMVIKMSVLDLREEEKKIRQSQQM